MKCHYDVLQVEIHASDTDIRKSYKKLALKWHPDKNLSNPEEAKNQFQLIQQAYEVLSDPQERSWYDRHRDSILKGGLGSDYQDESLNVYQYFNTNCFKGYRDDDAGFYAVYTEVFNKIAAEDSEFVSSLGDGDEIPVFGNSTSSYEDVVRLFYNYWLCYSTKKSYSWLDKYDIRDAPNRKALRLMEKENKKIRDKAKKERNEEVRALVSFVRKRDKRVQDYVKLLEEKALENVKRLQELQKKQMIKRLEEMSSYVESDWAKFSNLEGELKEIEASVANEFDDPSEDNDTSDTDNEIVPFCLPCNKPFKTEKALSNHEKSKKHKERVAIFPLPFYTMDGEIQSSLENSELSEVEKEFHNVKNGTSDDISDVEPEPLPHAQNKKKKKKKNNNRNQKIALEGVESDISEDNNIHPSVSRLSDDECWKSNKVFNNKKHKKSSKPVQKSVNGLSVEGENGIAPELCQTQEKVAVNQCAACSEVFSSKNGLFKHLKKTGHAVPLTEERPQPSTSRKKKK